jgi:cysteine desulfurase
MPEAVLTAYTDALRLVGNPSSIHGPGQAARELLETGREQVARSLGVDPVEVVLTGGGTESVNLAVKGLFWARNAHARRHRVIAPLGEHHATMDAVEWLARHEGAVVDWIELDATGRIRLDALAAALATGGDEVALVTALWANNEVGTVQPVAEIVELAHGYGVPVHLDAIAAYGQLPIDVHAVGADAVSVSAHKIGGPVGVGALALARSATVEPLLHGGDQQRGRSGTQDAAGAVAFGVAAALAAGELPLVRVAALRDRLVAGVLSAVDGATLRGDADAVGRLPGNAHFTFAGADGDALLYLLDASGIAVSTGSACQAGVAELSHVLLAMGVPEAEARGALRITLGHDSTDADVDVFLAALPDAVVRARAAAS